MRTSTWMKTDAGVAALLLLVMGTLGCSGGAEERGRSDEPLTMAQLQQWIDQYSNWGRWGEEDDLGALNLITPEKRIQAAALVRDGLSVSLAELQIPNVVLARGTDTRVEFEATGDSRPCPTVTEARISDLAVVPSRQDQSPHLDFWGSDVRNHTTEGDTRWVNYNTSHFRSSSTGS